MVGMLAIEMKLQKKARCIMYNILEILGTNIKKIIEDSIDISHEDIYEIRLRINSPVLIKGIKGSFYVSVGKKTIDIPSSYYAVSKRDIEETMGKITLNSIHAFEKELQNGYITIEGGHRIGLGGDCIYDKDHFKGFKNVSALNIRIAREVRGCSSDCMKFLIKSKKSVYNTLVVGPPLSGKTTFIRDIAANLSDGLRDPVFSGCDITIIDERGEIASSFNGIPQLYVGRRTDVLSYCMKKEGFMMSIRALSPQVIISDELGSGDDFEIIQYALKSGVNVITTAHGLDVEDLSRNIYLKNIIKNSFFERVIILSGAKMPSRVKQVIDIYENRVIFDDMG